MDDQQQKTSDDQSPTQSQIDSNTNQQSQASTDSQQPLSPVNTPRPEEPLIDLPKPKVELPENISDTVSQIDQTDANHTPPQPITPDTTQEATPTTPPSPTEDHTVPQDSKTVQDSPTIAPAAVAATPIVSEYLHTRNKPATVAIVSIVLLVIAAGLSFLYVQNNRLKSQIRTIEDINSQRETTQGTPTPTAEQIMAQKNVFSDIQKVVDFAKAESPTAQLLMITSNNLSLTNIPATYNYWFRTATDSGQYFQVLSEPGKDLSISKPATVDPDNQIPDLIENVTNNTLGMTDTEVVALGWEKVGSQSSDGNKPISISGVYIKSVPSGSTDQLPVNLWQITYFFAPETGTEDIIIQVNATTKEILFNNKDTQPSATPSETSSS